MNDHISRQALLDKFEPWLKVKDYNDGELNMLKAILYEIRFMPPATDKNVGTKLSTNLAEVGTDTISRQQAIDALRYAQHRFTVADEAGGMGTVKWSENVIYFAAAERVLTELPPAQPEHDENDLDFVQTHKRIPVQLVVSSDLISRQAAINKILGQPPEPHYPSWYAEQIKELPSAQPDIVRCRDCRYYNHEEKECLDLLGYGRRWEEDDFCSYGEMEVTE